MHAQVGRILLTAVAANNIAPDDRTYLAQIVSARTGMSMDDAQKPVDDVVNRARASVTQAADTARKAGAYLSFWTFMSLLFGAACATLGGMLGGDLRDDHALMPSPRFNHKIAGRLKFALKSRMGRIFRGAAIRKGNAGQKMEGPNWNFDVTSRVYLHARIFVHPLSARRKTGTYGRPQNSCANFRRWNFVVDVLA